MYYKIHCVYTVQEFSWKALTTMFMHESREVHYVLLLVAETQCTERCDSKLSIFSDLVHITQIPPCTITHP